MKALPRVRTASAAVLIALTGALLAAASPAAAQDTAVAERTTSLSACVGAAVDVFGFEDIDDLSDDRQDAINCLAYYGITAGTTATTFGPGLNVTRSQMALFLYRTAAAAGVDFDATADDPAAMFSDISDLGDARQAAVKALYAKSIMSGRNTSVRALAGVASSDTFVPHEPINRAEMAVYLRNLVRAASPDLFDEDGALIDVESLDAFDDARRTVPAATSDAIATIYEMGITTGQTPTIYAPAKLVHRSNMALFITRTIAHTTLRPAGLTVQQDGAKIVASLRDRHFSPVDDAYVDVFVADTGDADEAFDNDGSCDRRSVREAPRYYHVACEIDAGDERTDNGDVTVDMAEELTSDGLVVWVWSGRLDEVIGDEADEDDLIEVRFDSDSLPPPEASTLTITYSGLRSNPEDGTPVETARTTTRVTVKLQLQGSYLGETDLVDVPSPAGGAEYSLTTTATIPDDNDQTDDRMHSRITDTVVLDADGSASFQLPVYDLAAYDVNYKLGEVRGAVAPPEEHRGTDGVGKTVMFRSGDPTPTSVVVDPLRESIAVAPSGGTASIRNNVRVTVLDQFGRPMAGVNVLLISSADSDVWRLSQENRTFTTRGSGVVIGYVYSGDAAVETVSAGVDNDADTEQGNGELNCGDSDDDLCGSATVYWVTDEVDTDETDALVILDADTDDDTIMVNTTSGGAGVTPAVVSYDIGDYFNLGGVPVGVARFEEALTERLDAIEGTATSETAPDSPTLTWDNYHPDEPADESITSWSLTIS